MEYKIDRQYVVTLPDEASSDAVMTLMNRLDRLLYGKPDSVSVDCAGLENINSPLVGVLWLIYRKCTAVGAKVLLLSAPPGLKCVLKVLDLYDLFQYDTAPKDFSVEGQAIELVKPGSHADEFRPERTSIEIAMDNFVAFLSSLKVPDMKMFELKTVFYEVATNIRNHSGMSNGESILFTALSDNKKIALVFADSGRRFDITKWPADIDVEAAGKNGQKRGFGIALVRRLADKIEYMGERTGLNILIIEKTWR